MKSDFYRVVKVLTLALMIIGVLECKREPPSIGRNAYVENNDEVVFGVTSRRAKAVDVTFYFADASSEKKAKTKEFCVMEGDTILIPWWSKNKPRYEMSSTHSYADKFEPLQSIRPRD